MSDNPKDPTRRRRLWFRLAALGLSTLVVFGIPELIVRAVAPEIRVYRKILFGGDENSLKLFMKDRRLQWVLRPDVACEFMGATVRTDARGNRAVSRSVVAGAAKVVLCLGDSTTFGWGVAEDAVYCSQLGDSLNEPSPDLNEPSVRWDVHNAGVPGYTSLQVLLRGRELIPALEPEVVVVCVGNNEAWPVKVTDAEAFGERRWYSWFFDLLGRSDFLVWAAESFQGDEPEAAPESIKNGVPRVSLGEYRENLMRLATLAEEHGATVIFMTSPVNLQYPPMPGELVQAKRWAPLEAEARALCAAGNPNRALEVIDAKLTTEPGDFALLWLKGIVLANCKREDESVAVLESAFEAHPFPDRCKQSYRNMVKSVAAQKKAPVIDVNAAFRSGRTTRELADLYKDWCHPTPDGHGIIAAKLAELIAR